MCNMSTASELALEIESMAAEAGIGINALCDEADVARSTFTRWKNGDVKHGGLKTYHSLIGAIKTLTERQNDEGLNIHQGG